MVDYANERTELRRAARASTARSSATSPRRFAEYRAARTLVYDTARRIDLAATGQRVGADAAKLFARAGRQARRRRRDPGARRLRLHGRVRGRAAVARRQAARDRRRHARGAPQEHHQGPRARSGRSCDERAEEGSAAPERSSRAARRPAAQSAAAGAPQPKASGARESCLRTETGGVRRSCSRAPPSTTRSRRALRDELARGDRRRRRRPRRARDPAARRGPRVLRGLGLDWGRRSRAGRGEGSATGARASGTRVADMRMIGELRRHLHEALVRAEADDRRRAGLVHRRRHRHGAVRGPDRRRRGARRSAIRRARVWGTPTTAMWVYRMGLERAKRYLLTGDEIPARRAAEIGLDSRGGARRRSCWRTRPRSRERMARVPTEPARDAEAALQPDGRATWASREPRCSARCSTASRATRRKGSTSCARAERRRLPRGRARARRSVRRLRQPKEIGHATRRWPRSRARAAPTAR